MLNRKQSVRNLAENLEAEKSATSTNNQQADFESAATYYYDDHDHDHEHNLDDARAAELPSPMLAGQSAGMGVASAAAAAALELAPALSLATKSAATRYGWFDRNSMRYFMRLCSIASLVSVCANTSKTFSHHPNLMAVTFAVDLISGLVFSLEMALKIRSRSFISGPKAYARDRWCQFDASMVLFIWISVLLQVFELLEIVEPYSVLSVLRSPRPLILVRFIRVFFKFSLPKSRIKQIFKRSSQQIYNVTLFFLFFMTLYGLLGVQLFGQIEKHCVVNGSSLEAISINSLAIPDTHCSGNPHYGNQCPPGMVCLDLHLPKEIVGYNGFDHIGHSLYTVYQTSSQEGWAHLMYSTFDHYAAWKVAAYFVTLIFFLGWMVRNVFIAVFTETFNEIRVQFQQMWGERQTLTSEDVPKVLRGDDETGWNLVELDEWTLSKSRRVPMWARTFLNSAIFQVIVLVAILTNVVISASLKFQHDGRPREHFYKHLYKYEVVFTLFFNIEALFKILCLGFPIYWTRTSHRFELILAIGCSIHILPPFFMTELADFQVFRVIRLIKASPVLEDFAYKSFGPIRKLGSLIVFTVCLLVVTSAMTMQLFCSLTDYHRFEDFPYAFMSMFQILTQEAWTDVMNETMLRVRDHIGPYVAVYFIMYHLFVSLIVLSLFVAVILDNLELPEDLKKAKQEKAREQIACISEELPLRLRLFEHFPDSPQMTKLNKLAPEFNVPKVRESFMRNFVDQTARDRETIKNCIRVGLTPTPSEYMTNLRLACNTNGSLTGQPSNSNSHSRTGSLVKRAAAALTGASATGNIHKQLGNNQHQRLGGGGGGGSFTKRSHKFLAPSSNQAEQPSSSSNWTRVFSYKPSHLTTAHFNGATSSKGLERSGANLEPVVSRSESLLRTHQRRAPTIKLLTAGAKGAHHRPAVSSGKLLRRRIILSLIEQSNAQRSALMDEHFNLVASRNQAGVVQVPFGRNQQGNWMSSTTNNTTAPVTATTAFDYLKESNETNQLASNGLSPDNSRQANPQDLNIKMLKRKRQQAELKRSQRERDLRENHPLFDTPLFIVGRESKFREYCQLIAWAKYQYSERDPITGKLRKSNYKSLHNLLGLVSYFDWLMIVITTISCVSMMFETPTMRVMNTPALQVAEYIFVVGMSLELSLKTLANGLLFTPKALLSTVAGALDLFIFISSLIYAIWMPQEVEPQSVAQFVMLLRCVRPLRVFSLIPHMRQVVYELVRGFKAIFLVCILLGLLCFVFACYGVHIFGGRLARCTDPTIAARENCTGTFLRKVFVTKMRLPTDDQSYPALLVPRVWANPHRFSFDDIKSAMLALFEVLSFKGWVDIREALLKRFDSSLHWLYIHIFVFFGCMVGVTLFVGVVIANYGENKGTALLTVDQRRWCDLKKRLKIAQPLHLPPRPDHTKFRAVIYDIIQHIAFKRIIAFLVLCNSSLLIVHWDPEDESHTLSFATASACLTLAFTFEVLMKSIAFTPRGYWQSRRNRYDLVVTLIGCLWVLIHFVFNGNTIGNTFGLIVVILRFFTITGKHATLQMLMLTVVVSVYKSFFIILGLFVLVLFYSLLGVQLFGSVKFGENLSRQANFRSAKLGTITMFRIVTGEDWYRMMHDCMIGPPYCTSGKNVWQTDCGNFSLSFVFFSSFYIIITHIVLNLLVAIIMENFSLFYSSEEDALLSYTDIRNFQNTWNMVDGQQRGSIPVRRVKFVLRLLKGRLEVDPTRDQHLIKHMCHEMERLHNGEDVSFHDVLSMLSYRSVDINKSLQFEELLERNELESVIEEEVAKKTIRSWLDQCLRRVKRERQQQNSLIQGLRLTNLGAGDLFMSAPAPPLPPQSAPQASVSLAAVHRHQSGPLSTSSATALTPAASSSSGVPKSATGLLSTSSDLASSTNLPGKGGGSGGGESLGPAAPASTGSQHSITSAATIATIAASIGRLKRRVEITRAEAAAAAAATSGPANQRKLLLSNNEQKKDERSQQLRRALKALTNPVVSMSRLESVAVAAAAAHRHAQQLNSAAESEEANLARLQYRPKLKAAISDIHEWWNFQIN